MAFATSRALKICTAGLRNGNLKGPSREGVNLATRANRFGDYLRAKLRKRKTSRGKTEEFSRLLADVRQEELLYYMASISLGIILTGSILFWIILSFLVF